MRHAPCYSGAIVPIRYQFLLELASVVINKHVSLSEASIRCKLFNFRGVAVFVSLLIGRTARVVWAIQTFIEKALRSGHGAIVPVKKTKLLLTPFATAATAVAGPY